MRTPTRTAQTAAHAKSPAPIPLRGLQGLILGHASAREMRLPFQTSRKMDSLMKPSSKHELFDDAGHTAGAAHMPVCLCCGEDVDFAQRYHPVQPFCSHCVSERCRKCRSWVRVRKFQRDPTYNLIGRHRGPRIRYGGVAAPNSPGAICAHFTICPKRPGGIPTMETAEGDARRLSVDSRRDRG